MLLTDLLSPDRVLVPLRATTKDGVMRELAAAALPAGDEGQLGEILAALHARESLLSTGIGQGVAIPHAKTPLVADLLLVAGSTAAPVDFDALDGRPVDLFFLLLGPEAAPGAHVKALGRISRVLRRPGLCEALRRASDAPAFYRVIADSEAG